MFKNKYIILNLAANEDVTPGNRLVRIGDDEFLAFTIFLRCRFINFWSELLYFYENWISESPLNREMESWIYMETGRQLFAGERHFAARRKVTLIFSLICDDRSNGKDISRENLKLVDHLAAWVLNAKTPNPSELFSQREKTNIAARKVLCRTKIDYPDLFLKLRWSFE